MVRQRGIGSCDPLPPVSEQGLWNMPAEAAPRSQSKPEFPVFIPQPHGFVVAARLFPILLSQQRRVSKVITVEQAIEIVFAWTFVILFGANHPIIAVDGGAAVVQR